MVKSYSNEYYENNKEKIKEYYRKKITCKDCGATFQRSHLSNHKKTEKHLKAEIPLRVKYKLLLKKYKQLKKKLQK